MWISKRNSDILAALIKLYTSQNIPVSSKQLSNILPYSCSLIRKELQNLEANGFITKNNASSGRVPSDKGIKNYIRKINNSTDLNEKEIEFPFNKSSSFNDLSNNSASLLSSTTNNIGFVYFDSIFDLNYKKARLIKIGPYKVMAILKSRKNWMFSKIFTTNLNYSEPDLKNWENILNSEFSGRSLKTIHKIVRNRLYKDKEKYIRIYRGINFLLGSRDLMTTDLIFNGTLNFIDSAQINPKTLKKIIETLEEKEKFAKFLRDILDKKNINPVFAFGKETGISELDELMLIISNFYLSKNPIGKLGVIGPKFMRYSDSLLQVRQFSSHISNILSKNPLEA
ncbi:MAG: hypothetical protein ABFR75_12250 [Acidobacteriota bacterium]